MGGADGSGAFLTVTAYGPAAVDALRAGIDAAKGGDPLAPVTVVPPSTVAGLSLRRHLGARGGLVNTRFMPLARVAELLGAPGLAAAGRRPLTDAVRGAAVRRVLAEHADGLADVADHPATERALRATFADLDAAGTGPGGSPPFPGRGGEVLALHTAFRSLVAGFYDRRDLAVAAAEAIGAGASVAADLGTVVLHLPWSLSPADLPLLEALANTRRLRAVVGLTGDPGADAPAADVLARLEALLGPSTVSSKAEVPAVSACVVAPDPGEEARVVVRQVAARLDAGQPLHSVAVLHPAAGPYASVVGDAFAAAGIPHHSAPRRPLAVTAPGRALRGLLALATSELRRRDVMAWLHASPVLEHPGGRPVPVSDWDRISREAGVVRGANQWRHRLEALERRREARLAELASPEESEEAAEAADLDGRRAALAHEIETARRLRTFVTRLVDDLRAAPDGSWAALTGWASDLLVRLLGTETERVDWPEHEDDAFRRIDEQLAALHVLDGVEPAPTLATFRRAVDDLLASPAPRHSRFGDGVFVGRVDQAAGACFDTVFVVGMVEGEVPARGADDPLLPDHVRAAHSVPPRRRSAADERRAWLAALATAPERVLTTARSDPRSQQARHPAPWFVDAASALAGRRLTIDDLDVAPATGAVSRVCSSEAGLRDAPVPASPSERDLRALLAGDSLADPVLAAALAVHAARSAATPTPHTGFVGAIGAAVTGGDPLSPTSLEKWAACPFRYFAASVLRVGERLEPEDVDELDAADRGSVVHTVLEALVLEHGAALDPGEPWPAAARAFAHQRLDETADDFESRGRTGRPLVWQHQRARLHAQLTNILDADDAFRAARGSRPVEAEMPFGLDDTAVVEVPVSEGRTVRMRGIVDRVDATAGGLVVLDYKTGSDRPYAGTDDDWVDRGRVLQLGAYALAARARYGDQPVDAHFWFVSDKGRYRLRPHDGAVTPERLQRYGTVVGLVADGIEAGRFPARPGGDEWDPFRRVETFENCRYCPYDPVCPADRDEAWDRIRDHDEVRAYADLAEDSVTETPGDEG